MYTHITRAEDMSAYTFNLFRSTSHFFLSLLSLKAFILFDFFDDINRAYAFSTKRIFVSFLIIVSLPYPNACFFKWCVNVCCVFYIKGKKNNMQKGSIYLMVHLKFTNQL